MDVTMKWTYSSKSRPEIVFVSEPSEAQAALAAAEDLEKTGRVKNIEFIDDADVSWNKKELKKLLSEIEVEPHDAIVYFDGGYDKEAKLAGIGAAVYFKQGRKNFRLRINRLLSGIVTNNEAEYAAFYEAVQQLEQLNVHHQRVIFRGDSQVVLKQLEGEWPCYEADLNRWLDRIEAKLKKLGIRPSYEPVPRKENQEADQLATQALRGEEIAARLELKPD